MQAEVSGVRPSEKALMDANEAEEDAETAAQLEAIFAVSHDIKGQGGSFDYQLMTIVGNQLCRFIENLGGKADNNAIEVIELHMTHGYLVHQFFSPLSNTRSDNYGGALENRMRFGIELMQAVHAAVPKSVAVGVRIAASDWVEGGVTVDEAVTFTAKLKEQGAAYACVSSGGLDPAAKITVGPGYQVGFADEIKKNTGITTRAVGMIVSPEQAEEILVKGQADQIALARAFLDNPRWGWHAADALGVDLKRPPQYDRVRKALWPGEALKHK
jgi:2,4-dienoyl-CoA reductase-like NADH-dependent reductase (Old Yellow Enzyme family)